VGKKILLGKGMLRLCCEIREVDHETRSRGGLERKNGGPRVTPRTYRLVEVATKRYGEGEDQVTRGEDKGTGKEGRPFEERFCREGNFCRGYVLCLGMGSDTERRKTSQDRREAQGASGGTPSSKGRRWKGNSEWGKKLLKRSQG